MAQQFTWYWQTSNGMWIDSTPRKSKVLSKELRAEPIVGWRVWAISKTMFEWHEQLAVMERAYEEGRNPFRGIPTEKIRLTGIGHSVPWDKGKFSASCSASNGWIVINGSSQSPPEHGAPDQDCMCGIWAFKDREDAVKKAGQYGNDAQIAIGSVRMWGKVIEHEIGYRSEHGQPIDLIVFNAPETIDALCEFYDCTASSGDLEREKEQAAKQAKMDKLQALRVKKMPRKGWGKAGEPFQTTFQKYAQAEQRYRRR